MSNFVLTPEQKTKSKVAKSELAEIEKRKIKRDAEQMMSNRNPAQMKKGGKISRVKKYNSGKMVSGAAMTEGERKRLEKALDSAENASSSSSNKNLPGIGAAMSEREFEQLLPPGGDPGEGYRGSPDMYPDYEEDRKEAEKFKNKNRNRNSSDKTKSMANGGYVMVKTKLGRNKPTKIC